tara:strand:+ start:180 stop:509 length:330 start_codon:yes stop_codon:yes gene_type:complete
MDLSYNYKAIVVNVTGGNTLLAMVDLGFEVWIKVSIKLFGIHTGPTTSKEGKLARDRLEELLRDKEFYITSMHLSKYGRCLAEIITKDDININELLIEEGHATVYLKNE